MVDYESLNSLAYEVFTTFFNLKITLGTAESMTGGLIGHLITNQDGASSVFGGSIVVYTAAAKSQVLKIPMEFIHREGTISKKMVESMMEHMKIFPLDVILAISGIAGKEIEVGAEPPENPFVEPERNQGGHQADGQRPQHVAEGDELETVEEDERHQEEQHRQ